MTAPRNVVLVVMDTTRVDDAFDPTVAPHLCDLGDAGTRATQAFSTAPWTLPAHGSLFTGSYPSRHGAHADHERLDDSLPVLPEIFQAAGYETVSLSNNTWVSVASGLDRGFDTFVQLWQAYQSSTTLGELVEVTEEGRFKAVAKELLRGNPAINLTNALYRLFVRNRGDDGAERTVDWIDNWLETRSNDRPFFMFVNFLEPHLEYRPDREFAAEYLPSGVDFSDAMEVPQDPWAYLAGDASLGPEELEILRGLYRAELAYLDRRLGDLVDTLKAARQWEDTLLIVLADHGENIGDHGFMDHQYCLYDTLIHVPLVLHGGTFTGSDDIDDLVSLVDIPPTILDAVELDASEARESFQGSSFHPSSTASPRECVVSEYMAPMPTMDALERHLGDLPPHIEEFDRSLRAIRTPEFKLIRGSDESRVLYRVGDDAAERVPVTEQYPDVTARLEEVLDEWVDSFQSAETDGPVHIDAARQEQLEELGYLQ